MKFRRPARAAFLLYCNLMSYEENFKLKSILLIIDWIYYDVHAEIARIYCHFLLYKFQQFLIFIHMNNFSGASLYVLQVGEIDIPKFEQRVPIDTSNIDCAP